MKIKSSHHVLTGLNFFSWMILGVITAASTWTSNFESYENLAIGSCFWLIGIYWYSKGKTLPASLKPKLKKFLLFENFTLLMSFLISLLFIHGACYRMFIEKLPVFG